MSDGDTSVKRLPGTLQRLVALFNANLIAANDEEREGATAKATASGAKKGAKSVAPKKQTCAADGVETLSDEQLSAVQSLFPQWLQVLYMATSLSRDSEKVSKTSGTANAYVDPRSQYELACASSAPVPLPVHGLMGHAKAVEETVFTSPHLALIPTQMESHTMLAAVPGATPLPNRAHAVLPPHSAFAMQIEQAADAQWGGSGHAAALPARLRSVASLSWLHHSWVSLILLHAVSAGERGGRQAGQQSAAAGSDEVGVDAQANSSSHSVAATATAIASACDAVHKTLTDVGVLTEADGRTASTSLSREAVLRLIKRAFPQPPPVGEALMETESALSSLSDIFFFECCRVAAGGDALSFQSEQVPIHIFLRVCHYLQSRTLACLSDPEAGDGHGGAGDFHSCRKGVEDVRDARSGVLVAVAVESPMTGMRTVKRLRRLAPPAERAGHHRMLNQVGFNQRRRLEASHRECTEEKDAGSNANRSSSAQDPFMVDGDRQSNGSESAVIVESGDSADASDEDDFSEEESELLDDLEGSLLSSSSSGGSGGGGQHSPASARMESTIVQCETALASLLFTCAGSCCNFGGGEMSGGAATGREAGGWLASREAYGRSGHLCWFVDAGSKAHQRQLLQREKQKQQKGSGNS